MSGFVYFKKPVSITRNLFKIGYTSDYNELVKSDPDDNKYHYVASCLPITQSVCDMIKIKWLISYEFKKQFKHIPSEDSSEEVFHIPRKDLDDAWQQFLYISVSMMEFEFYKTDNTIYLHIQNNKKTSYTIKPYEQPALIKQDKKKCLKKLSDFILENYMDDSIKIRSIIILHEYFDSVYDENQ